jgi:hypothetical protein
MVLSLQQVQDRILKPVAAAAISEALDHENRIKFHTKPVDKKEKACDYYRTFLNWVETGIGLPADKFQAFEGMCQFPLPTTALCNSIFDEYEKIFTAQDAFFDVELLDDTMKQEFQAYIEEYKIRHYFQTTAFKAYKKQPACIFVVDLPSIQTGTRPEPYFYKVPISKVVDISMERSREGCDRIGMVIFQTGVNTFVQIDDGFYRLIVTTEDKSEILNFTETPHGLGYAPATFLPQHPLYDEEDLSPIARKTQISDVIGDLDWLLFYKVAERMYETYGPFPILTIPDTDCDYTDALGAHCSGGIIATTKNGQPWQYDCPVCKKNSLAGPGTVFYKSVPRSKDDPPELSGAVTITPADVASLKHITEKIDFLEWEIYANCVGSNDQQIQKQAINQDQVQSNVEGKRNVLASIRRDFEACEKFIIDTMGRLMFGDYYITATVNYGEQVLLYTASDVVDQYMKFKEAGLPTFMIAQKKDLLIQTETRNNPYELRRSDLLNRLEPWPDLSLAECLTYQLNALYKEKFALKLDFAKFVSKFEAANGDIVQWGSLLSLDQKINRLTQILLSYGTEETSGQQQQSAQQQQEGISN